ncbi:MAG: hypothetical protein M0Q92_06165 [Methanoregula sp.]|jgi:hypothetical protein|nr:hypothetical protein [Methanoregula sp.]
MRCGLSSTNVVCLYSIPEFSEGIIELKKYFEEQKGFTISEFCTNASVGDLAKVPRCSVFCFATHAGRTRDGRYFLVTGTADTPENIRECDALYDIPDPDNPVCADYDHWVTSRTGLLVATASNRIAVSEKFIAKYWRFEPNSLVWIQACNSMNKENASFRRIIQDICGAGAFAGWTEDCTGYDSDLAMEYVFDRLLGVNINPHGETPPQRPFTWDTVLTDLKNRKFNPVRYPDLDIWSELCIEAGDNGDFGLLAPSIEYADINENDKEVTLHGYFGTDQSKIRVFVRDCRKRGDPGIEYELIRNSSTDARTIVCKGLPDSGTGSAGYLVAVADYGNGKFVESNPVPITSWKGKFTYTMRLPGEDSDSGMGQITIDVVLRGEIHRPRKIPGGDLLSRACIFNFVQDKSNTAQFTSNGSYTDRDSGYSYKWYGSGKLSPGDEGSGGRAGIFGWHRHISDPAHPKLFVNMFTGFEEARVDIRDQEGREIITKLTSPINVAYLASEKNRTTPFFLDFLQGSLTWNEGGLYAPSYDIPEKTITGPIMFGLISSTRKILTAELTWETLKAEYAPDDETPG